MKRTIFYIFVGLILASTCFSSCEEKPRKGGRTDTATSGAITFASDESFSPIIDEEREAFEFMYKDAKLTPLYMDEFTAVDRFMKDSIELIITSRNMSPKQMENMRNRDLRPKTYPLAYDGLALIVNKENTDTCITVNDVKRILLGEVTKWNEIYPNSKRGEIILAFDNKHSSTVKFCEDSILGGKAVSTANAFAVKKSKEVVEYVEKTPNAIGIIGSNYLNDNRDSTNTTFIKNVNVMAVSKEDVATEANSWKPYQYYLYTGHYAFIRTIYAWVNDPYNGLPWSFAQYMANPRTGQLIFHRSALLPYYDTQVRNVEVSSN